MWPSGGLGGIGKIGIDPPMVDPIPVGDLPGHVQQRIFELCPGAREAGRLACASRGFRDLSERCDAVWARFMYDPLAPAIPDEARHPPHPVGGSWRRAYAASRVIDGNWRLRRAVLTQCRGHSDMCYDVRVERFGDTCLTASADGTVRAWQLPAQYGPMPGGLRAGAKAADLMAHVSGGKPVTCCAWAHGDASRADLRQDGKRPGLVVSSDTGGTVAVSCRKTGTALAKCGGVPVTRFALFGGALATATWQTRGPLSGEVRVYDVRHVLAEAEASAREAEEAREWGGAGPGAAVEAEWEVGNAIDASGLEVYAVGCDGGQVLGAIGDGTVRAWDVWYGKEVLSMTGCPKERPARCLDAEAKDDGGWLLAVGGADGGVRLFDRRTGMLAGKWAAHVSGSHCNAVRLRPGRNLLVSGGDDGLVTVCDLRVPGKVLGNKEAGRSGIVALDCDHSRLVVGSEDTTVRVFDFDQAALDMQGVDPEAFAHAMRQLELRNGGQPPRGNLRHHAATPGVPR